MSVVAAVSGVSSPSCDSKHKQHKQQQQQQQSEAVWCLTKGSPEAVLPLLDPATVPEWYTSKHRYTA
jgi:hypothetical protein